MTAAHPTTHISLTAQYLRTRFRALNHEFFDDQLPEPRLMVSKAKTLLGQFSYRRVRKGLLSATRKVGYTIKVSEYYEQTAEQIDDTLLHEMIHYYIAYRGLKDTSAHGIEFRRQMERLNQRGRHITVSANTRQFAAAQPAGRRRRLVLALEDGTGHKYLSVVNPAYKKYVDGLIARAPAIVRHRWLVSDDDFFTDFSQVRSLRARRVTAEKFEEITKHADTVA